MCLCMPNDGVPIHVVVHVIGARETGGGKIHHGECLPIKRVWCSCAHTSLMRFSEIGVIVVSVNFCGSLDWIACDLTILDKRGV